MRRRSETRFLTDLGSVLGSMSDDFRQKFAIFALRFRVRLLIATFERIWTKRAQQVALTSSDAYLKAECPELLELEFAESAESFDTPLPLRGGGLLQ